jgi:hypothetical protein
MGRNGDANGAPYPDRNRRHHPLSAAIALPTPDATLSFPFYAFLANATQRMLATALSE